VQIQTLNGGKFSTMRSVRTNGRGFIRTVIRKRGAARQNWRLVAPDPSTGAPMPSRVARAGRTLRFFKN
jgi:hypothetical protein